MSLRKIKPIIMPSGFEPSSVDMPMPKFDWVDPESLYVDETYQRGLSERSLRLIRKIVTQFDWKKFKPPVVTEINKGLHIIDGQHTAIAAATHPAIDKIPVMVVVADSIELQAQAFLGQNVNRLKVSPLQLFVAECAAGDPDALTVKQVCERAHVRILKSAPGAGAFKPGDTMAVEAIKSLVKQKGAMYARSVIEVMAKAGCAPISAAQIRAVDMLLRDPEYVGTVSAYDLTTAVMATKDTALIEAKTLAAKTHTQLWKAMAIYLYREVLRGRARAA